MGPHVLTGATSSRSAWRCSSSAAGASAATSAGEQPGARRGAATELAARSRARPAARAAVPPRSALPVQHAERDRRVVPRGRRAAERAVLQLSAMLRTVLAGVRAPPGRWPRSWRWSTRCSSCTACAIRTAAVHAPTARRRCPTSGSRRCCCCRWPRTRSSTARRRATRGDDRARPRTRPPRPAGRVAREPRRLPGPAPGRQRPRQSSSAGWRSPMMAGRC